MRNNGSNRHAYSNKARSENQIDREPKEPMKAEKEKENRDEAKLDQKTLFLSPSTLLKGKASVCALAACSTHYRPMRGHQDMAFDSYVGTNRATKFWATCSGFEVQRLCPEVPSLHGGADTGQACQVGRKSSMFSLQDRGRGAVHSAPHTTAPGRSSVKYEAQNY